MAGAETLSAASFDRDPIEQLADSFIARFRAGERPSIEEYANRHPELANEIRELLPALVELELNHSPMGSVTGSLGQASTSGSPAPRQLGDYLIIREIGRGGMGVVYEAVQQSLGRHVAIKVLPQSILGGSSHLDRFRLEARAAARLHHTNIVPVFGVGEQEGVHYYAMQFIQGQGLDEVFEELRRLKGLSPAAEGNVDGNAAAANRSATDRAFTIAATHGLLTGQFSLADREERDSTSPGSNGTAAATATGTQPEAGASGLSNISPMGASGSAVSRHSELSGTQDEARYYRSVARVGLQVAEALAYAHSQGILHRDIKPSNLLLDAKGTVWVTDFGLAKTEGTDALTHTGDIVGTLRYMAPERFDGWSDPRSDVYALGVTLYELLTLHCLFTEANRAKLIDRVVHEAPAAPRKLDPRIPRDLETIVLKAVAKEPGLRYHSAEVMADDLQRFLADKPIQARRTSPTEQAWRWCRRNPALAGASALAFLGLAGTVVALAISNARISASSRALAAALHDRGEALEAARKSEAAARLSADEAARQMTRAEAGEDQARRAVDEFLNKVTEDQLLKAPGMQALRGDLLRSALRFYDGFLKQRGDDPNLQTTLAGIHLRVGQILRDLGDAAGGNQSYLAAKKLYKALATATPGASAHQDKLATCLLRTGDNAGAIAIWEKLLKADSANPGYRNNLGDAYNSLAIQQGNEKKPAERLQSNQKARELREALVRDFPDEPDYHNALASTLNNLGVLLNEQGHGRDALAMYQRAAEHGEAAFAKAPHNVLYGRFLGIMLNNVASTMNGLGRQEEAEHWFGKTVDHYRRICRDNPAVPAFHALLYKASYDLGKFRLERGRLADSEEPFRVAAQALESLPRSTPGDLYNLACVQARIASSLGLGRGTQVPEEKARASQMADAAMETLKKAVEAGGSETADHIRDDADLAAISSRSEFQILMARLKSAEEARSIAKLGETGSPEDKLVTRKKALAARSKLAAEDPQSRRYRADQAASQYSVGQILSDLGRHDEARKEIEASLAIREALAREEPRNLRYSLDVAQTRLVLGHVAWKAGRLADANRIWKEAFAAMEAALKSESEDSTLRTELDAAKSEVAGRMLQLGLAEEPAALLDEVFRRNPSAQVVLSAGSMFHEHTVLRVLAGDLPGFHASCAEFFRQQRDSESKFNLYRSCFAGPDPLPSGELDLLIAAAERELKGHPREDWYLLFPAMLHERAGHHAKALEILDRHQPDFAGAMPFGAMRAIVLHHLGREEDARKSLLEEDSALENVYREALGGDAPRTIVYPETVLLREAFRREAHALLDGTPPRNDPYRLLVRGRVLARMGRTKDAGEVLAAILDARPDDPVVMASYARVMADLGRADAGKTALARAMRSLDESLRSQPENRGLHRLRGELLAFQGKWNEAAADLGRSLVGSPEGTPRWFLAGAWVVGPYPFRQATHTADRTRAEPPEADPDPFQPVAGPDAKGILAWKPATLEGQDGHVALPTDGQVAAMTSHYVLTRVYSADVRTIGALVKNDDEVRLWCNGTLLLDQPLQHELPTPVVVPLRPGWNTILAKVSNWAGPSFLELKLTEDDRTIAQAFGAWIEKRGYDSQALDALAHLYGEYSINPRDWQPRRFLDQEVVRREPLFQKVAAARPKDTILWLAKGQWLIWNEQWNEALAAYERYVKSLSDVQDAHFEHATLVLLVKGASAHHEQVSRLIEQFGPPRNDFTGYVLARTSAMAPDAVDNPGVLPAWANPLVVAQPKAAWPRHALGLALLRAGEDERAIREFEQSIKDNAWWPAEKPVLNWLGLALAHHHRGQAAEGGRWYTLAADWMTQKEKEFADRKSQASFTIMPPDWLEARVLHREATQWMGQGRLGNLTLGDQTVTAGQPLRVGMGPVSLGVETPLVGPAGSFRLAAPCRTKSPVADGKIGPDEYGPPLAIDFTGDENPGRIFPGKKPVTDPADLSAALYLAYTKDDLFVAVRVRDDKIVIAPNEWIPNGDSVELFIDGDRQSNDFDKATPTSGRANPEGFQLGTDASGRTFSNGIKREEYVVATAPCEGGYVVEYRIPLRAIDTDDGGEVKAPGPGSTLRFNLAIVDNDEVTDHQNRYATLWSDNATDSLWADGERVWSVDLHLARPVVYELVEGPTGATVDPETGVLAWLTPVKPQATKMTVRVRDLEKPAVSDEASFTVTTTAPKP